MTSAEDAAVAWSAGADAIGLNFWPRSRRCVSPSNALRIARGRPDGGKLVGVFVDQPFETILEHVRELGLDAVQLHGDEPPEGCRGYGVPVIKALRVRPSPERKPGQSGSADPEIERARLYTEASIELAALLLDGDAPGYGGGGVAFHWPIARLFAAEGVPIVVAGGLTVANVAEAIAAAKPYAVDVASGVESAPGKKDAGAVRAFVAEARRAAALARATPATGMLAAEVRTPRAGDDVLGSALHSSNATRPELRAGRVELPLDAAELATGADPHDPQTGRAR